MVTAIFENGFCVVAGEIKIHNYCKDSGEYLNTTTEYIPAGVSIPALSTTKEPLKPKLNHACVWINGAWEYVEDHRGETVYSTEDASTLKINCIGEYPDNTTKLIPLTSFDKWVKGKWVTDKKSQQDAQASEANKKRTSLINEATAEITPMEDAEAGGFLEKADEPKLLAWKKYRYAISRVDASAAPDIVWPEKPKL